MGVGWRERGGGRRGGGEGVGVLAGLSRLLQGSIRDIGMCVSLCVCVQDGVRVCLDEW